MDISRSTVKPCPADAFCLGHPYNPKTITRGTPSLPDTCPAGTKRNAGTARAGATPGEAWRKDNRAALPATSAANGGKTTNDCNRLIAGYYYDGTNAAVFITKDTVLLCKVGWFCSTEGLSIDKGTETPPGAGSNSNPGLNPCITAVSSLAGSKVENDCNIIQP
jgi:hypothetical protein